MAAAAAGRPVPRGEAAVDLDATLRGLTALRDQLRVDPRWALAPWVQFAKIDVPGLDAVDLQALLDNLADFLLQSGFAGGGQADPWGWGNVDQGGDRSLDALRQAVVR